MIDDRNVTPNGVRRVGVLQGFWGYENRQPPRPPVFEQGSLLWGFRA